MTGDSATMIRPGGTWFYAHGRDGENTKTFLTWFDGTLLIRRATG